jgi:uroporphyrinogen decarboxylase
MPRGTFVRVLDGESVWPPPIWMMRQAGRYLPEYRAVRAEAGSFLDLCYTPRLAIEVALQPIRRFGFDASILFSDILVVPQALGQTLWFQAGEGPRLEPLAVDGIAALRSDAVETALAPVYEVVAGLRARLPAETGLIGFCGAPWTVATYMIAGRGTDDQAPAKRWAYGAPEALDRLVDVLVEASALHLIAQLRAGADAVQIFDTWAGSLDEAAFDRFVVAPTRRLVRRIREAVPGAKVIGFPRGASARLQRFVRETEVDGVSLDAGVDAAWAREHLRVLLQGNLDPLRLLGAPEEIDSAVERLLETMRGARWVFNLGHGITPEAPISAVERMVARVRAG